MDVFETSSINLSMRTSEGQALTANVYTLEGVQNADGSLRELSISQLVMAICLAHATEVESKIVAKMETMSETSAELEKLTELDEDMVNWYADTSNQNNTWCNYSTFKEAMDIVSSEKTDYAGKTSFSYSELSSYISDLESVMDSRNSTSQTTLIDIQSLTSKRDDTYNLISNVLKSLNTVLTGNANNL